MRDTLPQAIIHGRYRNTTCFSVGEVHRRMLISLRTICVRWPIGRHYDTEGLGATSRWAPKPTIYHPKVQQTIKKSYLRPPSEIFLTDLFSPRHFKGCFQYIKVSLFSARCALTALQGWGCRWPTLTRPTYKIAIMFGSDATVTSKRRTLSRPDVFYNKYFAFLNRLYVRIIFYITCIYDMLLLYTLCWGQRSISVTVQVILHAYGYRLPR